MFPFDIPNRFRSILTGDFWSTKVTDTDTKVTVSCKGLFYWHSGIFIWLRITVKIGKLHSVSLLEMRLSGNRHESSNLSVSASNNLSDIVFERFFFLLILCLRQNFDKRCRKSSKKALSRGSAKQVALPLFLSHFSSITWFIPLFEP